MAVPEINKVDPSLSSPSTERPAPRRAWTSPELVTHESLTVMTQHFFGPAGALLALQVTCSVVNGNLICH
jgi:hypothetical protein